MTDTKRRISNFLPEVLQTDLLKKFFAATGDHLFQPEKVEYLSSYIGQKPVYFDPQKDQYVSESSKDRTDYQVEPTATVRNSDNNAITHSLFYDDLLNKLRFQGGLVNDHNRLFEQQYYSWGLPVDIDKFINYQNYVWLATGPLTITLLDQTDINSICKEAHYQYTGRYQLGSSDEIIDGAVRPLTFSSGLKIKFTLDVDVNKREIEYIVEGVGQRIRVVADTFQSFLAWENPQEWDSSVWDSNPVLLIPNYVLIARGSSNENPWSYGNRWFHKDVLTVSGTPLTAFNTNNAKRPILEFDHTIRLWNFGTRSRGMVNVVDTTTTNINQVVGAAEYLVNGVPLDDNMTVLFTNLRSQSDPNQLDPQINNRIYQVTNLRNAGTIVLQVLANGSDLSGAPLQGDCINILQGSANVAGTSWYYNGTQWVPGQSRPLPAETSSVYRQALNKPPLFELFDTSGNSLADPAIWPGSNFSGCTLINYLVDPDGIEDPELGFATVTENQSARNFVFEVSLVSQEFSYALPNTRATISGFKFWQSIDPVSLVPQYLNNWFVYEFLSRQYVVNQYVSTEAQTTFDIDQIPLLNAPGPSAVTVSVGTNLLSLNKDYKIIGKQVVLNKVLDKDQFVQIRTWAGINNTATSGFFEIPSN